MRPALICLLLLLSSIVAIAQKNLSGSSRTSAYTYVYKIDPKEARLLFNKGMQQFNQAKFLHTLVDSFLEKGPKPQLPPANYLLICSWENELLVEQYDPKKINCRLIGNNYDLQILVTGPDGDPVKNAQVKVRNKQVPFDPALNVYKLSGFKKQGVVEVNVDGALYFFRLGNPMRRPLLPVKRWVHKLKKTDKRWTYRQDYFSGKTDYESRFSGFMVFSKPIYKPGDTVKFKAWVMPKKGKPVNRPLILRLTGEYFSVDTIIATIPPYRPGGYEYSFVLNDSLDLDLDEHYLLTLEEESSRKFDLDEYDGDLDEDEYALKRQVLIRNKFWHEEYELKSVSYKARTDKALHNTKDPVSLFLKATDENEMAVMDGRVSVLIRPDANSAVYKDSIVFLKDTLWLFEQPMDAVGETKIVIPDSIFPAASFSYRVYCSFLNSNNERHDTVLTQHYRHQAQLMKLEQRRDSLLIRLTENGQPGSGDALLIARNAGRDTIQRTMIRIPAAVRVHPFAAEYIVINGRDTLRQRPENLSLLNCSTQRTADSVFIQISNPAALPCWYTVFNGKKMIRQGRGEALDFSHPADKGSVWFVSIQYIYQDAVKRLEYSIPFDKKELNVQLKQPEFIYPGQQTPVEVVVTDGNGHPVADADITLYGFTAKFPNAQAPDLPFMDEAAQERKARNYFALRNSGTVRQPVKLDWEIWSRRIGLDSIEYYKFLYPDSIYINYEPAMDSITQLAPFVVSGGSPEAIHMLYIDDQPYFFRGSQQWHQYSFPIDSGWHSLKMRIHNKEVYAKRVYVKKGVKTIVSVSADSMSAISHWAKMPDTLTTREKLYWDQYLILVDNNFNGRLAWINQGEKLLVFNQEKDGYWNARGQTLLVGPLRGYGARINVKDRFARDFNMEGGFRYTFASDLVKMRQLPGRNKPYNTWLSKEKQIVSLFDQAITKKTIDSLWRDMLDYRLANAEIFHYYNSNGDDLGRLEIGVTENEDQQLAALRSVLLFRKNDPDFLRVYKGVTRDLGMLHEGQYRLFLLLKNGRYLLKEDLVIRRNGTNFYSVDLSNSKPADSTSLSLSYRISRSDYDWSEDPASIYSADSIRTTFNRTYLQLDSTARTVTGVVTENGQPLAGVQVMLKNTRYGTVSMSGGFFSIKVPESGTLVFSYVGYETVERSLDQRQFYEVVMTARSQALSEVVVAGYGVEKKRAMTGAVMSVISQELKGKLPGVSSLRIRGLSSMNGSGKPLIIKDGLPVDLDLKDIDESEIADMQVMPADKAIALWGSRAAAGVIVITTKKKLQESRGFDAPPDETWPGNNIRTNFRDEAYWFPSLRTGVDGKASVRVQFPDDITNWRTFAIAMTDKRQAGLSTAQVKSFKAISGTLYQPNFAVAGDELNVLGKAMNYTPDSISLKRSFSENGKLIRQDIIGVKNSRVDTFTVVAGGDSLKLSYSIQRNDGYFDGEERKIKVFPQGVTEPYGIFAAMDNDTVISWKPEPGSEVVIHAETTALPVLMDEVEYVHNYEYFCNEQLASKLKALLLKRKVYKLQQKKFENDKDIREIISKLNKSKSEDNLWGWWKGGQSTPWITLHVVEALLAAEQQQFTISMSREMIAAYLVYSLDKTPRLVVAMVPKLRVLKQIGTKILFKPWLDTLAKYDKDQSLFEQLSLLAFRQELDRTPVPDSLLVKRRQTVFGNVYWGEQGYHFFDNSIQNTLLMYRILKTDGNHDDLLKKIRRYFMEKRSDGHWRNTYESVLILEAILPDLMEEPAFNQPSSLVIRQGGSSHNVTAFPFHVKMNNKEEIRLENKGQRPVYFTASQQKWNPAPEKVDSTFSVRSVFRQGRDTVVKLKAGVPVLLEVEVKVNADASYVMLEIPIPAGCSYNSKEGSYYNNEVNREHFLNKTSIFCSELRRGTYRFTVSLLPRYTGTYHLNPAHASMMYFPVFFGREGMKKVNIK